MRQSLWRVSLAGVLFVVGGCAVGPPGPIPGNHLVTCCNGLTVCGASACPANTCGQEQRPRDTGQPCNPPPVADGGVPDATRVMASSPPDSQRVLIDPAASRATLTSGGVTTTTSVSGVVNVLQHESGSEITRIQLGFGDFTLAGASFRSGFLINDGVVPIEEGDGFFTIRAGSARAVTAGLMNNVQLGGALAPNADLFGRFDGKTFSLSGTMSGSGQTLTFQLAGTAQPFGTDTDGDGVPDVTDNCPRVANPSQAFVPAPGLTAPPAVTITSCSSSAALALGRPTLNDVCGAPPLTVTNDAPATFSLGTTTVTWTAADGASNVNTATQIVTVLLADDPSCCPAGTKIIMGTSNNDILVGTSGRDCILGLGAQDQISGGGGDDFITGGDGDDVLRGESGNDMIFGGSGQDRLEGGVGKDKLFGDAGDDICLGGDGDDELHGGSGQDRLFGEGGNDTLNGDIGDDRLDGGPNVDICIGGGGHETFLACETIQ
jgi:Ca2+-binding RTX toxin-like protein